MAVARPLEARLFGEQYEYLPPRGVTQKVDAGWKIAARRALPRRCYGRAGVRCQGSGRAAGPRGPRLAGL